MAGLRFGVVYESVGDAAISSGLTMNALRLFVWSTRHFKSGDKLEGIELAALESWIAANAPEAEPKAVQVVQFSHRQAAEVFNDSRTESGRQIARLVEAGIFEPIGEPSRGHCQLYVVCPKLHTPGRVQNDDTNSHTPGRVQNEADLHTLEPICAHIEGDLRTHPDSVTCDDVTYPIVSNTYPIDEPSFSAQREAEKPSLVCPACGSSDTVQTTDNGFATCSCGSAWRA